MKKNFLKFVSVFFIFLSLVSCSEDNNKVQIQMQKTGGVYQIPCKVNGVSMNFIFDTGASNVCISLTEALYLYKNGKISDYDLGGSSYSQVADGSIVENTHLNLKNVEIGGITLNNVDALVVSSLTAPLLLGQSAIQRLGSIEINGDRLTIYPSGSQNISNSSNNYGLFTKIRDYFNDGWHYEGDVYSVKNYKLKLYSKYVNGVKTYQVEDRNKNKYVVYLNENFGNEQVKDWDGNMVNYNGYRFRYVAGNYAFNMPGDNVDADLARIKAEKIANEAKKWKFSKRIKMYGFNSSGAHMTKEKQNANLYWRKSDGRFMVVPCGIDYGNEWTVYDKELGATIYHEPKERREIIVERNPHYRNYEVYKIWDEYNNYYEHWEIEPEYYEYEAAEFSLNL